MYEVLDKLEQFTDIEGKIKRLLVSYVTKFKALFYLEKQLSQSPNNHLLKRMNELRALANHSSLNSAAMRKVDRILDIYLHSFNVPVISFFLSCRFKKKTERRL